MKEDLNMWITAPGWINEHLQFMGNFEVCLYRVEATRALIIGGGMMHVVPELDRQISAADKPDPSGLVIQHSHADHCGAVSYLRWRYPGMEVLASPYACDLFSREKVMRHIELANRNAVRVSGEAFHCAEMGIECTPFTVDRAVCEGDVIELGEGLEAHIMEVPGHTRCSIAVYIPAWKMLFPSDALPVPVIYEGSIHFKPSPQYSYSSYMQSLRRLEKLNFDVMALEHHGVFTGPLARDVLLKAIVETGRTRELILGFYRQTADRERTAALYVKEVMRKGLLSFIDRETVMAAGRAEVRSILRDAGFADSLYGLKGPVLK